MSFRALAVLSETFSVLEVGSLGVVRFGQQPEVVVPPRERIGPSEGAAVLANFTFSQPLTRFASLLRRCGAIFEQGPASASAALSDKLLVVLSDGRGKEPFFFLQLFSFRVIKNYFFPARCLCRCPE